MHAHQALLHKPHATIGERRALVNGMNKHDDEGIQTYDVVSPAKRGLGPNTAGQSGDTQGLSDVAEAGPESVEELLQEGQAFEAEVISGFEDAQDADVSEVHTRQVREDDVPPEYLQGENLENDV
jgi:hypothetical protein